MRYPYHCSAICALAAIVSSPIAAGTYAANQPVAEHSSRARDAQAAVERRAARFLELVNRGTESEATGFVSTNFAPAALEQVSLADRVEDMAILRLLGGSLRLVRIEPNAAGEAKLIAHSELLSAQELTLRFEPAAPYRLLDIGLPNNMPNSLPLGVPARNDAERVRRLDQFIGRLAGVGRFSGNVLLARGDEIIFERSYGEAERRFHVPNARDTRFYLASITKPFTAVAIAQLVEQGRVSWTDPISKFLPFPTPQAAGRIQIRHLLTHTSGLTNTPYPPGPRVPTQVNSLTAAIEAAPRNPLLFDPGSRYQYNNLGYLLLGRIVEIASGMDYYEYVQRHVFEPAGMTRTGTDPYDMVEGLSSAYEPVPSFGSLRFLYGRLYLPGRPLPFGGAYGTARDLLRFERALRSGVLVGPSTFRDMSRVRPEIGAPNWGYGFELVHQELAAGRGRRILGHGGNSMGVCTRWLRFEDAAAPYTFIVLSNSGHRSCFPVVDYALRLIPSAPVR